MQEKLKELLKNSYSPYSNYRVAAIVVMKDGKEFKGVNVENASYGAAICAERSAVVSAITAGYKKGDFNELHVMVGSKKIGTPCFICRQVISEIFNEDINIYCYNMEGDMEKYTMKELCPYPFNNENLNKE